MKAVSFFILINIISVAYAMETSNNNQARGRGNGGTQDAVCKIRRSSDSPVFRRVKKQSVLLENVFSDPIEGKIIPSKNPANNKATQ